MIRVYNTLYELATAIGWTWPADMPDLSSRLKFRVADTEDECWRVHADGTRAHRLNTETLDKWLTDFNVSTWSDELKCMVTRAHYNRDPKLRGYSSSPEKLDAVRAWRENNPDKAQAKDDRNNALPDHKLMTEECMRALRASEWQIDSDITLTHYKGYIKTFQANKPYKWSTLENYYGGSGNTQAAIRDGWVKL